MERRDFADSPVGYLARRTLSTVSGEQVEYDAFMPAPLPDEVSLTSATFKIVTEASQALGHLNGTVQRLPHPDILVRPTVSREAVASSALEGTFAALQDVMAAQATPDAARTGDLLEVNNAAVALWEGLRRLGKYPIHFRLAADLQAILVKGTRGDGHDAGRLRDTQVFISGSSRVDVQNARFVPPPPGDDLVAAISQWERWINADDDLPLVVKVALGHYQFETLHPFRDGNGRVGRLIMLLQLIAGGGLAKPVLNLSSYLEAEKDRYRDLLLHVSMTGAWDEWVVFIAAGIKREALKSIGRIDKLMALREQMRATLESQKIRGFSRDLVDEIVGNPIVNASTVAVAHGVSWPTANTAIQKLVKLGFLEEITGGQYGRLYFAPAPYAVIESD